MLKAICAVATAAVVATLVTCIPSFSEVEASTPAPVVKGERLDIRSSASCAERAWPYYGTECVRGSDRAVRLVTTDRLDR